ncbi:hypothetical protein LTR53_013956 [Teratosphaeriaceae sp. CCFEE 6253]|nr:hypothetical protein LTR53_013956 [Teratosphaeriaceae sp. CCFEE 6253]
MGHVRHRGRPKPPRPKCPPPPQPWIILHDQDPGITRLFAPSDGVVHVAAQTVRLLALDATKPQQTLAPILTAKRHAEKLGFFDLPPEVRILIYSRISDDVDSIYDQDRHIREIDNSIDAPTRVLAQAVPARVRRRERLLQLQLVSRQFRAELLPAWAGQIVHHGALPFQIHRNGGRGRASTSHKELPYAIWSAAREMLERLEARFGVGKSVRRIKLFSRSEALLERGPQEILAGIQGRRIAYHLEALDSSIAHPGLIVEVELVGTRRGDGMYVRPGTAFSDDTLRRCRRARRTMSFIQSPLTRTVEGRHLGEEWVCGRERLEVSTIDSAIRQLRRAVWTEVVGGEVGSSSHP